MSIWIEKEACIRCGKCRSVCPGSLIKKDEDGFAYIKYKKDCWGCASCMKECNQGAIHFYLGADIGGLGSYMYTECVGDITNWIVQKVDGTEKVISINRKESNSY